MKIFATLPALALVVALSSSTLADNGVVSEATLAEMGLAGIQVMSDEAALTVRGMGYMPNGDSGNGNGHHRHGKKPWSMAFGLSYAKIDKDGAEAGTHDGFRAIGKYRAAGEHFSEAGITKTKVHEFQLDGLPATKTTKTRSLYLYSAGFASSSSL